MPVNPSPAPSKALPTCSVRWSWADAIYHVASFGDAQYMGRKAAEAGLTVEVLRELLESRPQYLYTLPEEVEALDLPVWDVSKVWLYSSSERWEHVIRAQQTLDPRFHQLQVDPEEVMEAFCEVDDSRNPFKRGPFHLVRAFDTQHGPVSVLLVLS